MINLVIICILSALVLLTVYTDVQKYIIPNKIVIAITGLYPIAVAANWGVIDWKAGILVGIITFIIGFGIFFLRIMGGGDVKLMAALSLWAGKVAIGDFLILIAMYGGILSVFLILARRIIATYPAVKSGAITPPRIFRKKQPAPYGIAIAGAFLTILFSSQVAGLSF